MRFEKSCGGIDVCLSCRCFLLQGEIAGIYDDNGGFSLPSVCLEMGSLIFVDKKGNSLKMATHCGIGWIGSRNDDTTKDDLLLWSHMTCSKISKASLTTLTQSTVN